MKLQRRNENNTEAESIVLLKFVEKQVFKFFFLKLDEHATGMRVA